VVQLAIHALPATEQLVLIMLLEGATHREIAQLIGWRSHRAVGYWLRRACAQFAEKLALVEDWLGVKRRD
jgi:hypothetical protein